MIGAKPQLRVRLACWVAQAAGASVASSTPDADALALGKKEVLEKITSFFPLGYLENRPRHSLAFIFNYDHIKIQFNVNLGLLFLDPRSNSQAARISK